jgi:hypothetical protein
MSIIQDGTKGAGNITTLHERAIAPDPYDLLPKVPSFTLKSNDVEDGEPMNSMFARSRRGGQDISPELHWSSFPAQTKGFAGTCSTRTPRPVAASGTGCSWGWSIDGTKAQLTEQPLSARPPSRTIGPRQRLVLAFRPQVQVRARPAPGGSHSSPARPRPWPACAPAPRSSPPIRDRSARRTPRRAW